MRPNHARLFLLVLVAGAAWLIAAEKLLPQPDTLSYPKRGILIFLEPGGRVIRVTVEAARTLPGEQASPEPNRPEVQQDEIRPGHGALGIQLGSSADDALKRLGTPRYDLRHGTWRTLVYRDGNRFALFFERDTLTQISLEQSTARTAKGIAIGSPRADVEAAYGTPHRFAGAILYYYPFKRVAQTILRSLVLGLSFFPVWMRRERHRRWIGLTLWGCAGCVGWLFAHVVREMMTYGHPFSTLQFLLTAWRRSSGALTYVYTFATSMLGCIIGVGISLGGAGARLGPWRHMAPAGLSLLLPLALIFVLRAAVGAVRGVGPVAPLALGSLVATGPLAYLSTYLIGHSVRKKQLPEPQGERSYDQTTSHNRSNGSGEDQDSL